MNKRSGARLAWIATILLSLLLLVPGSLYAQSGDGAVLRELVADAKYQLDEVVAALARDVQVEAMLNAVFNVRELTAIAASDALSFGDSDTCLLLEDILDILAETEEEIDFTIGYVFPGLGDGLQEFRDQLDFLKDCVDESRLGRKRARLVQRYLASIVKILDRIEARGRLSDLEEMLDGEVRDTLDEAESLFGQIEEEFEDECAGLLIESLAAPARSDIPVTISAANLPPQAKFVFSPEYPNVNENVTFTDQSTDPDGTITGWKWDFDDGSTSTQRNPVHKFVAKGKYDVKLTVTDNDGLTNSVTKTVWVGFKPPVAKFTYTPDHPRVGRTVQFADQSTDADGTIESWSWTFGDGGTSSERNPHHRYALEGSYTVKLTVKDNDGLTSTFSKIIFVEALEVEELFAEADMVLESAERSLTTAGQWKKELLADLKRIESLLGRIDRSLRVSERAERTGSWGRKQDVEYPAGSAARVEVRVAPSAAIEFRLPEGGVGAIEVQLLDLAGRTVLQGKASGSLIALQPFAEGAAGPANGVYLYVVTAYSSDGKRLWSMVGKIIILR
jgi:PKD repeat protein